MLKVVKKANHTYTYITCMNFGDLKRILKVSAKITLMMKEVGCLAAALLFCLHCFSRQISHSNKAKFESNDFSKTYFVVLAMLAKNPKENL